MKKKLTKIQAQGRARRRRNSVKMRGLPTPPGTRPREFRPSAEPAWKPIPVPSPLTAKGWLDFLNRVFNQR